MYQKLIITKTGQCEKGLSNQKYIGKEVILPGVKIGNERMKSNGYNHCFGILMQVILL